MGGADFLIRKSTKTAATTAALFDSQYAPNRLSAETHWGAYSAPPDSLAVFQGPTSKGGEMGVKGGCASFAPGEKKQSAPIHKLGA